MLTHFNSPKTQQTHHQYQQDFELAIDKINSKMLFPYARINLLKKLSPSINYMTHDFLEELLRV